MVVAKMAQRPVCTVHPEGTLHEAAKLMCSRSVGALVITDDSDSTVLGVITDRDLVWMISEGLDPKVATISQFVRPPVQTVSTSDGLREVIGRMRELGVRRLPVVDTEKRLVGVISMDDVLLLLGREIADVTEAIAGELEHEHQIGTPHRQVNVG